MEAAPKPSRWERIKKITLWTLLGLCAYLTLEAFLPPRVQPSARAGIGLIHAYRAVGSPLLRAGGVRCKYSPSCSEYALDALRHYGTVPGSLKIGGRLWRCSPWGEGGYDPAVTLSD